MNRDLDRLVTYLNENWGHELTPADVPGIVDATLAAFEFCTTANQRFCEQNAKLDAVVSATQRAMKEAGFIA